MLAMRKTVCDYARVEDDGCVYYRSGISVVVDSVASRATPALHCMPFAAGIRWLCHASAAEGSAPYAGIMKRQR